MVLQPLPKTVLIVGGGPSGLVTLRNFVERGRFERVQLVERRDDIGGVWYLDKPSDSIDERPRWPSPSYEGLVGNVLPEFLSFSGSPFPPPATVPFFPTLVETHAYLKAFAEPHLSSGAIRLNTEVVSVEELEHGAGWRVISRDWSEMSRGKMIEERWDAVIAATGSYDHPKWPEIAGLEEARYEGFVKHAKVWKGPQGCENKRVVVIGNANSANDIATLLAPVAQTPVYRSLRHPEHQIFALHPDSCIQDVGPVNQFSIVSSGDRLSLTLHLRDGSQIADVDEVWVCTGYCWSVPFVHVLKEPVGGGPRELVPLTPPSLKHIPSLHRFLLYAYYPSLGFVNQVICFLPFILADVSSTWLVLAWMGEITYPVSVEERLMWEKDKFAKVEAARRSVDDPSSFLHYHVLDESELEYSKDLRKEIVQVRGELDHVLPVWDDVMWEKKCSQHVYKLESLRYTLGEGD